MGGPGEMGDRLVAAGITDPAAFKASVDKFAADGDTQPSSTQQLDVKATFERATEPLADVSAAEHVADEQIPDETQKKADEPLANISAAEYVPDEPISDQTSGTDEALNSELPKREPFRTYGDLGSSHDLQTESANTSDTQDNTGSDATDKKDEKKSIDNPLEEAQKQAEAKDAPDDVLQRLKALGDSLATLLTTITDTQEKNSQTMSDQSAKIVDLTNQLKNTANSTAQTVNNYYTNNYNNQGHVVNGGKVDIGNTNYGTQNIASDGSQINNIGVNTGDINNGLVVSETALLQAQMTGVVVSPVTQTEVDIDFINMLLEDAENMNHLAEDPFMPADLSDAAKNAAEDTRGVARVSQPAPKSAPTDQPAATPAPKPASDQPAPKPTDQPAVPPAPAAATLETTQKESEKNADGPVATAEALVGPLSEGEKKEFDEAGKSQEGFLFSIKRMFSGENWKRWIPTVVGSVAGSIGVKALAGAALASGPVGTALFGGVIVGLGIYTGFRTIRNLNEVAKKEGKTWGELLRDPDMLKGILAGGVLSGLTKFGSALVPGLGTVAAIGIEGATGFLAERSLNKKQQELVEKYMDTYQARRYANLKDKGYVIRGADGAPAVSVDSIVRDMSDKKLSAGERKTAVKAAIAAQMYLYEQTKDEAYRYIEYTVTENGKQVVKKVDVTQLALQETDQSTPDYRTTELTSGKINVESFIDTVDLTKLAASVNGGWAKVDAPKRAGFALEIVNRFVGLEAADVDKLLSEERRQYLAVVHFTTGLHTGMGAVNAIAAVTGGAKLIFHDAPAIHGTSSTTSEQESTQATNEYRAANNDPDATVVRGHLTNGHTVDAIDLDGNSANGGPDLVYDQTDHRFLILSGAGAEHVFELQHPELGNVAMHAVENPGNAGVVGTFTDTSGHVVGVTYVDQNGSIGVMNANEVAGHFNVTNEAGAAQSFTLGEIQPNGDAVLAVNGVNHNVNIGHLEAINIAGANGEIVGGPAIVVQPGASVNSLLHDVMRQVKVDNPGLAQYDDVQLERMMYQHGLSSSDSAIRTETGIGNPVQTTELSGKAFDWTKSPTIMGWLTELNNGQQINVAAGVPSAGTPGGSLIPGFAGEAVPQVDISGGLVETTGAGGALGFDSKSLAYGLPLIGAALLAAFNRKSDVGGISRQTVVTSLSSTSSKPGDDKKKDEKTGIERSTEVGTVTAESKEVRVNRVREIIVKQVLKNVRAEGYVTINGVKYTRVTGEEGQWKAEGKDAKSVDSEALADLLLNQEDKANIEKELGVILNGALIREVTITLEDENDQKTAYKKTIVKPQAQPQTGRAPKATVEWVNTTTATDKKNSSEMAKAILAVKDKVTQVATPAPGGKPDDKGGDGAPAAEAQTDTVEAEAKIEKRTFNQVAEDILKAIRQNQEGNRFVMADGVVYEYRANDKTWVRNDNVGALTGLQKFAIAAKPAPDAPQFLSEQQVIDRWNNSKSLEDDLTSTLSIVEPDTKGKTVKVEEIYRRVTVGQEDPSKEPKGIIWSSKSAKYTDAEFAKKIVALRTTSENAAPGKPEAKDGKTEAATTTPEKEQKGKKSRWLLKTALVVAGVAAGIAAHASGVAAAAAIGAGAALLGMGATQKILEGYAARRKDLQAEITATAQKEKRDFKPEELAKIKEYERKREIANRWIEGIRVIRIGVMSFGITSTLLGIFNPQFGIDIKSIDISATWKALIDKVSLLRTPTGISSPETNIHYGQ